MASVTVNTPVNGAQVSPQFTLSATATTCSNQTVAAMGFSLDSSSNTTIVQGTSVNATVTAATGAHALHVKAWGNAGAACDTDVAITVTTAPASSSSGVTVSAPLNNATVGSPFALNATAASCSSQPVTSMGYSLDDSSNTTVANGTSVAASVTASAGAHTLHMKAWGNAGASCVANVAVTVGSGTTASAPAQPASTTSGVNVTAPSNNATVGSPFTLTATAATCSSQPVTSMGYSLDDSSNTAIVQGTSVAASVTASAGAHLLHVKAWGNSGAACDTDAAITVGGTSAAAPGGVTISNPAAGQSVTTPFTLVASASTCSSQPIVSIGYGVDNNSKTVATGGSLNTQISAALGAHTLNITAWGNGGAYCNASVTINVTNSTSSASSVVPSNANTVSSIQTLGGWTALNDPGTGASSSGTMAMVSSPSLSGNARQFITSSTNSGGERYSATFADDTGATNFFYDAWVYIANPSSNIANLEMDTNQVMSNGQTVIFGFQCDGYSGTWDYTKNAGTPANPIDQWIHSSATCNVRSWETNVWHHVQVYYSRDNSGNVTYHSVWLDGTESQINATVPSAFALGWGQIILTNLQVDGLGTGFDTVYVDNLTISRW